MTTKIIAMVTVLASIAMLTGLVATTTPITAAYADKNERESNLKCKGSGTATGQSSADNFISCEQGSEGIGGQPGSDEELQVRQVTGEVVPVFPRDLETSLASCAAGGVVTGGGFTLLDDANEINPSVWSFKDPDSETWSAHLLNPSPTNVFITQT